jgi:mannose-1-phosphate guanylyltransferase
LYANDQYLKYYGKIRPEWIAQGSNYVGSNVVDATAKVDPSAKIGPNVYIGPGVVVGKGVRISNTIVLSDCSIKVPCQDVTVLVVAH